MQLNPDGSPALDQNHNPVPTYDQSVVTNMAKVLTGWTYPTAPGATAKTNNPAYYFGQMFAVEAKHDTSAKTIFGNITIPAGQTAEQDLESVLDALMAQPTMAPFVCQQLIQHLVTSNPSPAYIQRVSKVFPNNGSGVTGDMKAVITAILTDPEARAGDNADALIGATSAICANRFCSCQPSARPERDLERDEHHLQPHQPDGAEPVLPAECVQLLLAVVPDRKRVARTGVPDLLHADRRGPG